jgi:hypothetical protein
MSDDSKSSANWSSDAVVARLRQAASKGPVSAQVFLSDDVVAGELPSRAEEIVAAAAASLNLAPDDVKLGKVHRLAKSFSVTSGSPDLFERIATRDDVKSILESAQPDILPRPSDTRDG